jgi:hypothetical protein
MEEIGSGTNYRISFDKAKNRIYFWFFGDIMNPAGVAGLPGDLKKAVQLARPAFTGLADFSDMKLLGLPDVAQDTQATLVAGGIKKVASVWNRESFAKFIVDSTAAKVGDKYSEKRKIFFDRAEAEAWLDE